MTNITIDILDRLEPDQIDELPPGTLADLQELLAQELTAFNQHAATLHAAFERRYSAKAAAARLAAGKDTGAVHLVDGEYDITVTAPKKVTWDQAALKNALNELPEGLAHHYAKVVVAVEERKFEAAAPDIRKVLAPARTVSTGKTVYSLSRLEEAAA